MNNSKIFNLLLCLNILCACSVAHLSTKRNVASQNGTTDFSEEVLSEPIAELNTEDDIPTQYSSSHGDYSVSIDTKSRVVAFNFNNTGVNRIIPKKPEPGGGPDRGFSFNFTSRARQDIYLDITDAPTDRLSELMSSYFYFFPRKYIPAIKVLDDKFIVTLPTGEEVEFNGSSKEIVGGVLKEGLPIDQGPDRFKRKFPDIKYTGSGVMLRADRRGEDPRIASNGAIPTAKAIKVSSDNCSVSKPCECLIPKTKLWEQGGQVHFLFKSDEEFNNFLKSQCKFGF
jgi:hypothetical protein